MRLTKKQVIERIEKAEEYTEEEVKEACKEAFSGEHGEFLLRTIEALIDYYDLRR